MTQPDIWWLLAGSVCIVCFLFLSSAFVQAIYERLFAYVVKKINESVKVELPEGISSTVISVIDIYGFEVFGVNR